MTIDPLRVIYQNTTLFRKLQNRNIGIEIRISKNQPQHRKLKETWNDFETKKKKNNSKRRCVLNIVTRKEQIDLERRFARNAVACRIFLLSFYLF